MESLNAELIHMKLPQGDRLARLNQTAIRQIETLAQTRAALRLEGGRDTDHPENHQTTT